MKKVEIHFPEAGMDHAALMPLLRAMKTDDAAWREGKVWSMVYHAGAVVAQVVEETYCLYFHENALNPGAFPSLSRMENEVVAMAADLLGSSGEVVGNMTSGGTESILNAVKCARDYARSERDIIAPEMVLPITAHPAFEKAAHCFGVKAVHTPVLSDMRADTSAMRKAITQNTILLVASAPSYPHGVVDPIEEIASIAHEHGILCHVDACIGGFMLPFVRELGYPVPAFDFRVKGVTSVSADLHKYGYTAKGASLILYRSSELRRHQYFVHTEWPGGIYASPTLLGTRPGGAIAAAWAVIKCLGRNGYREIACAVMETAKKIRLGIEKIPSLYVIGKPEMSVVAFASDRYDIFLIGDEMTELGWHMDRQQLPNSLHLTVTPAHAQVAEALLKDLFTSVAEVRKTNWNKLSFNIAVPLVKGLSKLMPNKIFRGITRNMAHHIDARRLGKSRTAAIYGITAALSDRGDVHEMVVELLDNLNKNR